MILCGQIDNDSVDDICRRVLNEIIEIIDIPYYIQEDVLKYKMICEVINNEVPEGLRSRSHEV